MILDALTRFSVAQPVTTGTQVSTNSYDTGSPRDIGRGSDLRVRVTVGIPFTGGSSLQVNIVEDTSGALASPTVALAGVPFAEVSLTAGKVLLDVILPATTKRFIGLQFVNGRHPLSRDRRWRHRDGYR